MFYRNILELFSSLETRSLINNIEQQHVINIYYIYNNIIIKLDIILNRKFKPTRRFSILLVIFTELGKIF
jgi:hypothetical protein